MGRTACTEPQCLYKGDLYLYLFKQEVVAAHIFFLLAFLEEPFIINMLY